MQKEPDRNPRKALGKGLSALLPQRSQPQTASESGSATAVQALTAKAELPENFEEFQSIPLDQIQPNDEQPRTVFDAEKLEELSQSIRANGLIQPITVHRLGDRRYRIIAGERRWQAARLAGLKEIPALVRNVRQDQLLELALIENIQREDLNPIEVATAFQRLSSEHGLSHEQIAERTGKDRSTITNFLRLLKLSARVRDELIRGSISVGHARALLNVQDPEEQSRICQRIIGGQLSVRETEGLVKRLTQPGAIPSQVSENKAEKQDVDPNVRAAIEEMAMALGTRVRLVPKSETSGRLEVEYYSQDDLDRIYSVIVKQ